MQTKVLLNIGKQKKRKECEEITMDYLFKAKTTKPVKIDANNLEQAKRFFCRDYIIINKVNERKKQW